MAVVAGRECCSCMSCKVFIALCICICICIWAVDIHVLQGVFDFWLSVFCFWNKLIFSRGRTRRWWCLIVKPTKPTKVTRAILDTKVIGLTLCASSFRWLSSFLWIKRWKHFLLFPDPFSGGEGGEQLRRARWVGAQQHHQWGEDGRCQFCPNHPLRCHTQGQWDHQGDFEEDVILMIRKLNFLKSKKTFGGQCKIIGGVKNSRFL